MITKKQLFIMYATMILLILFSTIFGYSDKNYKPTYAITTANVNLRKNTTLNNSSIIKTVKKNTNVKIIGQIGNFNIVELSNSQVGLISKDYLRNSTTVPQGAAVYTNISKYFATINASSVNVRGGPSTSYSSYSTLSKGTKVEVIGRINNFNMIVTSSNTVGMIRSDLLSKILTSTSSNISSSQTYTSSDTQVNTILNLINKARKDNGLSPLILDSALTNVAKEKANDMVTNNYFSHTSKRYGSPFEMMQGFGISYKKAGENIAGNPSLEAAVSSWLASPTHKQNILSTSFNYVGIGVKKSLEYGYIIVVMFIQK